jgi:hypothetical protein
MKAGQVLRLAGQNYLNSIADHHREAATNQLNVVLSAAERFNAELVAVQDDDELSPEGRAAESAKVAAAALATLKAIETTAIKTLTDRAVTLEQSLLKRTTYAPPKDPAERLAHEMTLQEIRSQLRALSAAERLNIYRSTSDPMMLAAIETAPMTLSAQRPDGSRKMEPFVEPQQMSAVKLERAELLDPSTAQTLREVRSLREIYSHAVNSVRREIEAELPGVVI